MSNSDAGSILVTGATGYIGGRLVPRLIEAGRNVRVLVRSPRRARSRPWFHEVETVVGDAANLRVLSRALSGIDTAYYLIHSMSSGLNFHEKDIETARAFGLAAREAGVRRVIYLGALGESNSDLSPHLRSRHETGEVLRESGVSATEFRSAIIVGSGSASFEMIRNLVERLPVMICPRWVYSRAQPLAIDDLLDYLVAVLDTPESDGRIIEIGGKDVTTFHGLLSGYAKARGLRRRLIPVPVLTPRLSSYWVYWFTPIPAGFARALIEGIRNHVVVTSDLARELFPQIKPRDYASAITGVMKDLEEGRIDTSWSDAGGRSINSGNPVSLHSRHGMIVERRTRSVNAPARRVFRAFSGIGADRDWYFAGWAWGLRGLLDRLAGGTGLRRGRRHPNELRVGDAVDFWRVEALETDRFLRLKAEMKLPGRAWLQFETRESENGLSEIEQTVAFIPKGLFGLTYWHVLYPMHAWIFRGMVDAIVIRAESQSTPQVDM